MTASGGFTSMCIPMWKNRRSFLDWISGSPIR